MTSFYPDVNVWLALSDEAHQHHNAAWNWFTLLLEGDRVIFSRFTQLGLLRLLTSESVMGRAALTLGHAWKLYDSWLAQPRVEFHHESRDLDLFFRDAASPVANQRASKAVGDSFVLAWAKASSAMLVTFDGALLTRAQRGGCPAIRPE